MPATARRRAPVERTYKWRRPKGSSSGSPGCPVRARGRWPPCSRRSCPGEASTSSRSTGTRCARTSPRGSVSPRGSRHQHPPHRLRRQAPRPLRAPARSPPPSAPTARSATSSARDRAVRRGVLRVRHPGAAARATRRGSTRGRSPARSRASPASTTPTRRRWRPRSWSTRSRSRRRRASPGSSPKLEELGYLHARGSRARPRRGGEGLIAPHGGELVSRFVRGAARQRLARARGRACPGSTLDERGASDLELIGDRRVLPPQGLHEPRDYLRVVREMRLESGAVWSMPITLAVSSRGRQRASRSAPRSRSQTPDGRLVAVLELSDRLTPDKELEAREVYRTTDDEPPRRGVPGGGGRRVPRRRGLAPRAPGRGRSSPPITATRPRRGPSSRSAGGAASSGSRRATPSTARTSTSPSARSRSRDGLLLHPLVGATKADDIPADVRMRCYEVLLEKYYPEDRVLLGGLPRRHALRGPARGHLPRHRAQELRLLPLHRGARSRRRRALLRHVRRAAGVRRLPPGRARHRAALRSRRPSGRRSSAGWRPRRPRPGTPRRASPSRGRRCARCCGRGSCRRPSSAAPRSRGLLLDATRARAQAA